MPLRRREAHFGCVLICNSFNINISLHVVTRPGMQGALGPALGALAPPPAAHRHRAARGRTGRGRAAGGPRHEPLGGVAAPVAVALAPPRDGAARRTPRLLPPAAARARALAARGLLAAAGR